MSIKLEGDHFENKLGWNFGIQYRILMMVLLFGSTARILGYGNIGVFDIIIVIAGVLVLFTRSQLEYDFKKKQLREARYLFGIFIYGNWQAFPQFDYVSVFNERTNSTYNSIGSSNSIVVEELQVNLVYNKNRRYTICVMPDIDTALLAADYFAHKLGGLRILDATKRPFEWVDEK